MPETSETAPSLLETRKTSATSMAIWPWMLPFLILLLLLLASPNFRWQSEQSLAAPRTAAFGADFLQDWIGGRSVRSSQREKLYDLEYSHRWQHDEALLGFAWPEEDYYPVVYPPYHYVLATPFSWLPYRWAVLVAAVLSTLAFAASVWLLSRFYFPVVDVARLPTGSPDVVDVARLPTQGENRNFDSKYFSFASLMIGCCLFLPWITCLSMGQKSTVLLLLFTGTFLLLKAERNLLAGALFGLVAIKPQLGLVIGLAMIIKQQWNFVAGAGLTVGTLMLVSYLIQPTWWSDYFEVIAGMGNYSETSGYLLHDSHSLWGGLKFSLPSIGSTTLGVIGGLLAAMVIACVGWGLRGTWTPREARFDSQFAMLVLATLLLSPHLFGYDLTLAILPLVITVSQIGFRPTQTSQRWLLILCVAFFVLSGSFAGLAMVTGIQFSWMIMLAMLIQSSSIAKE